MGRPMGKSKARAKKERLEENARLVIAAMDAGHTTRRAICKVTGMKAYELAELFREDRDTFAAYTVRRKTMVDTAADNIQDIIDNPDHPSHFAASKYVLQNYKSDLDGILESHDDDEVAFELERSKGNETPRTRIVFSKKKKKGEEEN